MLVILAAVSIRGLIGDKGVVRTTETAAQDYKIAAYKEQIEQEVRADIVSKQTIGKGISLDGISKNIGEETTWIKDAKANVEKETTNDDVIVTTVDGYIYQVYYNDIYGVVYVEYVGREGKGNLPELKARYEKSIASIIVKTRVDGKDIAKLELIYKGEVKQEQANVEQEKEIRLKIDEIGTGWYIVRVTTSEGQMR